MRKNRQRESEEHRTERLEKNAQYRLEQAWAQDEAIDTAVRRSIKEYGA